MLVSLAYDEEHLILSILPAILENLSDSKVAVRKSACAVLLVGPNRGVLTAGDCSEGFRLPFNCQLIRAFWP